MRKVLILAAAAATLAGSGAQGPAQVGPVGGGVGRGGGAEA